MKRTVRHDKETDGIRRIIGRSTTNKTATTNTNINTNKIATTRTERHEIRSNREEHEHEREKDRNNTIKRRMDRYGCNTESCRIVHHSSIQIEDATIHK